MQQRNSKPSSASHLLARDSSNTAMASSNLKWMNALAFAVNVAVTYGVGVAGVFGLATNSELSEKYQTLVTPSGFTFSIWGIIFLSQFVWVLQQFCRWNESVASVGCKYALVVAAQVAWTLTFSNELIRVSGAMMLLILWNLMAIVRGVVGIRSLGHSAPKHKDVVSYLLNEFPFQIHCGWIAAASIVNLNVVLVFEKLGAPVQFYAAIGGLAILVVVSAFLIWYEYLLIPTVLAWALFGVYSELQSPKASIAETFSSDQLDIVMYSSLVLLVLVLALVFLRSINDFRKRWKGEPEEGALYQRAPLN